MAIARKPNSKPKSPMDEAAADAFIAGAAKPKAEPIATEADEAGQGAEPRKSPVMLRFDRALLAKVDAAAKRRGISRSAWIQFTVSRALDAGEGSGRLGRGGRSEEHTSELQSLMRTSYAVFCLKKKRDIQQQHHTTC